MIRLRSMGGSQRLSRERLRMRPRLCALFLALAILAIARPYASAETPSETMPDAALWRDSGEMGERNLLYGAGGEAHRPLGTMVFEEEDHAGTNPKFYVRDQEGTKWTAKLGVEARPETAAAHLLWAAGYFTDEDYFVPDLTVEGLPPHLQRGQNLVGSHGVMRNVRLERHLKGQKKLGRWEWRHNPFTGTRRFNGLRVMMALMNSWDLKDENNAIYEDSAAGNPARFTWSAILEPASAPPGTVGLRRWRRAT